jgi:hypothetical protein
MKPLLTDMRTQVTFQPKSAHCVKEMTKNYTYVATDYLEELEELKNGTTILICQPTL